MATPLILLPPEQEGNADVLLDLLIVIARRVAAERPENMLELPSQDQKQAA